VWPLAFLELVRSPREGSLWSRLHARQAAVFGCLASAGFLILFAVPFALSVAIGNTAAIIMIYTVFLSVDAVVGLALFGFALWYSIRASRGELFDIPLAAPISGRLFPIGGRDRNGA
jgi:hypothetical protein